MSANLHTLLHIIVAPIITSCLFSVHRATYITWYLWGKSVHKTSKLECGDGLILGIVATGRGWKQCIVGALCGKVSQMDLVTLHINEMLVAAQWDGWMDGVECYACITARKTVTDMRQELSQDSLKNLSYCLKRGS